MILLGIDSLRNDRTPMGGYVYKTCPTLETLACEGIYCSDAITHSGPTQFALPSVFTSTLPLDCGGYDEGITNRPLSLPEVFKQYGFRTGGFVMDCWSSSLGGYDRGFDESINLFDIAGVWRNSALYFNYYKEIKNAGLISNEEFLKLVAYYLRKCMRFTISFCHDEQKESEAADGKYKDIYHYDFAALGTIMADELEQMERDPGGYIGKHFDNLSSVDYFIDKHKRHACKAAALWLIGRMTHMKIDAARVRLILYKHFVSAEYLINRSIKWIEDNKRHPFFLWTFISDVHEFNCSTGKGKVYHQGLNGHLRSIGRPGRYLPWHRFTNGSVLNTGSLYDASIKYVDNNITKLVRYLKENSLMRNTLLVIFADHGFGLGSNLHPADLTTSLYEEYIRIPLLFFRPDIGPITVTHQCGLMDIGPTVLDLMGMKPMIEFRGLPVYSQNAKGRDHLIIENVRQGPCDIGRKPINIAVRTKKWKYMFMERLLQQGRDAPMKRSLYDLELDPGEANNLAGDVRYSHIEARLHAIAKERCNVIRNGKKD